MTLLSEIRHHAPLTFNIAEYHCIIVVVMLAKHNVIHDIAFREPFIVAHMVEECEFDAV